ncbi:MAG: response regulator [Gracilimonas sp.]|uniref:response regulator n=1 Tax=Gracilimonas sp. TaxID=1974203 RepID=UPI001B1EE283|nr:response regulator [Gracilimonas sp.]MBO6585007.1 response regulator [Gracilimonas sp.]MBO6615722.1 response regulator [Gracilimonas sp.]
MSSLKSICIIDDDKIYTYGVSKIIKNYLPGNDVMSFENGKKALSAIKEMEQNNDELPDLILLDIDMPEMNGWDFLNEFQPIREKVNKEIQIFVISSRIDHKNQEIYRVEWDQKVDDFIQKPVQVEALKSLLT